MSPGLVKILKKGRSIFKCTILYSQDALGWIHVSKVVLAAEFHRIDCFMWHGTRYVMHNVKACFSAWNPSYESCIHRELLSSVCWEAFSVKWWECNCLVQGILHSLKSVLGNLGNASLTSCCSSAAPLQPHQQLTNLEPGIEKFVPNIAYPAGLNKLWWEYCKLILNIVAFCFKLNIFLERFPYLKWSQEELASLYICCLSIRPSGRGQWGGCGTEDPTWETSSHHHHLTVRPLQFWCTLSVISSSVAQGKWILLWRIYIVLNDSAGKFYL